MSESPSEKNHKTGAKLGYLKKEGVTVFHVSTNNFVHCFMMRHQIGFRITSLFATWVMDHDGELDTDTEKEVNPGKICRKLHEMKA